jgi:aryl-alcohol dehydrogenase-like predicted oxidoreductase
MFIVFVIFFIISQSLMLFINYKSYKCQLGATKKTEETNAAQLAHLDRMFELSKKQIDLNEFYGTQNERRSEEAHKTFIKNLNNGKVTASLKG